MNEMHAILICMQIKIIVCIIVYSSNTWNDDNNIKHIISREGKLCVGGGFPPSV